MHDEISEIKKVEEEIIKKIGNICGGILIR